MQRRGVGGHRIANVPPATIAARMCARGVMHALAMELFGVSMLLPVSPGIKSIRGLGTSVQTSYRPDAADKLDIVGNVPPIESLPHKDVLPMSDFWHPRAIQY